MAMASVTLSYLGNSYTFAGDDQTIIKGRLACDCEKSRLIREMCDSEFPLLGCGSQIAVVSVSDAGSVSSRKPMSQDNGLRSQLAKAGE